MSKSTYSSKNESSNSSDNYENGQYDAKIGEKFKNGQYEIVKWLGNGTFSKVWLVKDNLNKQHCALKIQSFMYSEAAQDEIEMLKIVNDNEKKFNLSQLIKDDNQKNVTTHCVKLLDSFIHEFDGETYYCMVMEILGPTLLDLIQYYEAKQTRIEIELAKEICRQILIGLIYIHEICSIVHTDIKPENIMIELDEKQMKQLLNDNEQEIQQKKVKLNEDEDTFIWKDNVIIQITNKLQFKLVDFGNACLFTQQFEEIQTKEYKSPESIIKAKYSGNTDIWSLACVTYEILTNNYLFNPEGQSEQEWTDNLLAMMIELVGQPEQQFLKTGERSNQYFDQNGKLKRITDLEHIPLSCILVVEYNFEEQEAKEIEDFIMYQLIWDPKNRPKSIDVFKHKWIYQQQQQQQQQQKQQN